MSDTQLNMQLPLRVRAPRTSDLDRALQQGIRPAAQVIHDMAPMGIPGNNPDQPAFEGTKGLSWVNANPHLFGSTQKSRPVNELIAERNQVVSQIENIHGGSDILDSRLTLDEVRAKVARQNEIMEQEQFKDYVVQSMFGRDFEGGSRLDKLDPKVTKWDQKHELYEWHRYKEMFPEFLSDTYTRANLIIDLNLLFAKMTLHHQIQTREEMILMYLYHTDENVQRLVDEEIIEEFMKLREFGESGETNIDDQLRRYSSLGSEDELSAKIALYQKQSDNYGELIADNSPTPDHLKTYYRKMKTKVDVKLSAATNYRTAIRQNQINNGHPHSGKLARLESVYERGEKNDYSWLRTRKTKRKNWAEDIGGIPTRIRPDHDYKKYRYRNKHIPWFKRAMVGEINTKRRGVGIGEKNKNADIGSGHKMKITDASTGVVQNHDPIRTNTLLRSNLYSPRAETWRRAMVDQNKTSHYQDRTQETLSAFHVGNLI